MKNKNMTLVIVGIVIVAAILGLVAFGSKNDSSKSNTASSSSDMSSMDMSSSDKSSNPKAADAVATNEVQIENYAFSPQVIKVKVGDTVTWTNKDSVEHTVTSDDTSSGGGMDSKLLAKDETYKVPFNKAGTFTYHCTPHPYMKATVIVE